MCIKYVEPYEVCLSATGQFHATKCSQVTDIGISCLWLNETSLCAHTTSCLSVHLWKNVCLDLMNSAMMNTEYKYVFKILLFFFNYICKSRVTDFLFNFLRSHHTVFHSNQTILYSHPHYTRAITHLCPRNIYYIFCYLFVLGLCWPG